VGPDGSLKGYAGGIPLKERLLDFEASQRLPSSDLQRSRIQSSEY
jgi:hypothetical protein